MGRLHVELTRVNGLIASNAAAREDLAEDNTRLESRIKVGYKVQMIPYVFYVNYEGEPNIAEDNVRLQSRIKVV